MRKKVSIIIPCYNSATTLKRCLDSVIKQSYPNKEVIIVNDGSTDNSAEIISNYCEKYPYIRLINKENGGVSSARNLGLKHCSGEYIMFLDSDDNYTKKYSINKMINTLENKNVDCVACNFTHPVFKTYIRQGKYDLTNEKQKMMFYNDFFAFGMPWNKVFKRKNLTENYEERLKFTEDELFNIANLPNIKSIYFIKEVLHNYYCAPKTEANCSAINTIQLKKDSNSRNGFFFKRYDTNHLRDPIIKQNNNENIAKEMIYGRYIYFAIYDVEYMKYLQVPLKEQYKTMAYTATSPEFLESLLKCEKKNKKVVSTQPNELKEIMQKFVDIVFNPQRDEEQERVIYLNQSFDNLFYKTI